MTAPEREALADYPSQPAMEAAVAIELMVACGGYATVAYGHAIQKAIDQSIVAPAVTVTEEMVEAGKLSVDLKTLKAFLEAEAKSYVEFLNSLQARRTAEYKARGDADADYRGLSGIEETKYWPFIQIVDRALKSTTPQTGSQE